jgi:hypothetical protein
MLVKCGLPSPNACEVWVAIPKSTMLTGLIVKLLDCGPMLTEDEVLIELTRSVGVPVPCLVGSCRILP